MAVRMFDKCMSELGHSVEANTQLTRAMQDLALERRQVIGLN